MATINFYYRGKNETGNLTIRLKHSTVIDYRLSTDIVSNRKYWFKTNKRHRKLEELSYLDAEAKSHKAYLENFQQEILLRFENDFNTGVPISKLPVFYQLKTKLGRYKIKSTEKNKAV